MYDYEKNGYHPTFETKLSMYDVYGFCVQNHLYTKGNAAEYDKMLSYVNYHENDMNNEKLLEICVNIVKHSDILNYESENDAISNIFFELSRKMVHFVNFE